MDTQIIKGDDPVDQELIVSLGNVSYHIFKSSLLGEEEFIKTTLKKHGIFTPDPSYPVDIIRFQYKDQVDTFAKFSEEIKKKIFQMFGLSH
jgi:hypothetical protein